MCVNQRFSLVFRFKTRHACQMRQPVQNWSRQGKYFGTADAVWVHAYLRFEPCAWKWNEGLPCLRADCKIPIPPILFKFSHSILDWMAISWNLSGIFKNILEGSVDHVIYGDYIVNRGLFIYCSLATLNPCSGWKFSRVSMAPQLCIFHLAVHFSAIQSVHGSDKK